MKIFRCFPTLTLTNEEYSTLTEAFNLLSDIATEIDSDDWSYISPYFNTEDLNDLVKDINTIIKWSNGKVGKD